MKNMNKQKFLIAVLLTTVLLLSLNILITLTNSRNELTDVSVSGYGSKADHELYLPVTEAFLSTSCDFLFYDVLISKDIDYETTHEGYKTDYPKYCYLLLSGEKKIVLNIKAYSDINTGDKYASFIKKQAEIKELLLQDEISNSLIQYSKVITGKNYLNSYSTIIMHIVNDYDFAVIDFTGFNENELEIINDISTEVATKLNTIVERAYNTKGFDSPFLIDLHEIELSDND